MNIRSSMGTKRVLSILLIVIALVAGFKQTSPASESDVRAILGHSFQIVLKVATGSTTGHRIALPTPSLVTAAR